MARPIVSIQMEQETLDKLDELAEIYDVSRSRCVAFIIECWPLIRPDPHRVPRRKQNRSNSRPTTGETLQQEVRP